MKSINAETRTVTVDVQVRTSKTADPVDVTWTLDYADCDLEDLLERASRTDVITLQARYRSKPFDTSEFNVATDLRTRAPSAPKDPKAEVERLLAKMTPEERVAIFAEMAQK